jgi:hypothetical protein
MGYLDQVRGIDIYLCEREKCIQREWVALWLHMLEVPGSSRYNCNQPSLLRVLCNSVNAKFAEAGQHLCMFVCVCVCMLNAFVCGTVA